MTSFPVRALGGLALLAGCLLARGPLNAVLRTALDVTLAPFRGMHPLVGLTVLAVPVSIGALILFRETSDQAALQRTKDRILAGLFEIRLLNDDLRAVFRAQGEIFAQNLRYLGQAIVPLVWMIGPFVLLTGQLHFQYGYRGLLPGEETLLRVELAEATPGRPALELEALEGVRVDSPGVWAPARNTMVWRLTALTEGEHELRVRVPEGEGVVRTVTKTLLVSDRRARRAPTRAAGGWLDLADLLHPAEPPLPREGTVRSMSVGYEEAGVTLGLANWVWAFFGLTIVIGFALKGRFGVTI